MVIHFWSPMTCTWGRNKYIFLRMSILGTGTLIAGSSNFLKNWAHPFPTAFFLLFFFYFFNLFHFIFVTLLEEAVKTIPCYKCYYIIIRVIASGQFWVFVSSKTEFCTMKVYLVKFSEKIVTRICTGNFRRQSKFDSKCL